MSLLGASALVASAFVGIGGTAAAHAGSGKTEIKGAGLPSGVTCYEFDGVTGGNGQVLSGIQCTLTASLGGDATDSGEPGPIPLATDTGLIFDLNQWLLANNSTTFIQSESLVGIEAIGGQGRNGRSCKDYCTSGKGGSPGYSISVQTLAGMQALIAGSGYASTDPALYVFVGSQGNEAGAHEGGGGGSATWVTGVHPSKLDSGSSPDDALVFAIGGGGGGGGGVDGASGNGTHGGDGGTMTSTGPQTGGDTTISGTDGTGSWAGQGGSAAGDGVAGSSTAGDGSTNGGAGYAGTDGIGGLGGGHGATAGWVGTDYTSWSGGKGGGVGPQYVYTGGGGGGGWGGGGGGGYKSTGSQVGRGGGGGGTWARQSVADSGVDALPTLYNVHGSGFGLGSGEYSTAVLSFSLVLTTGNPGDGHGSSSSTSSVPSAGASSPESTSSPSASKASAALAATGSNASTLLAALATLVSAGALLVLLGRRRRHGDR